MSSTVDFCSGEATQVNEPSSLGFIYELLKKELGQLEQEIKDHFAVDNPMIRQAGNSIWNSGGKRARPILVFLSCRLCEYSGSKDVRVAAAMEMVHVASLFHDDVIDGAEVRRGNTSANAEWGNHLPILVGDYLYSWASNILMEDGVTDVLDIVIKTIMDMTDGEISEMLRKGDVTLTEEEYLNIIQKKTASLFSTCCKSGAMLADKDEDMQEKLAAFGMKIGFSFQLIDDILDYTAEQKKLGKPVGSDLKDQKMTLPMIHALRNSTEEEREKVKKIFSNDNLSSGDLEYCIALIQKYDSYNYTCQLAKEYIEQAKECLKPFAPSAYSEALYRISEYIINRSS